MNNNNNNQSMQKSEKPTVDSINGLPRVSLYTQRRLKADAPQGYVGHWFNDVGDRISAAVTSGWEFVPIKSECDKSADYSMSASRFGNVTYRIVGSTRSGEPLRSYFMIKKEAWHREDRANGIEKENAKQIESLNPETISGGVFDGNNHMRITKGQLT